jgi:hypothetical protein
MCVISDRGKLGRMPRSDGEISLEWGKTSWDLFDFRTNDKIGNAKNCPEDDMRETHDKIYWRFTKINWRSFASKSRPSTIPCVSTNRLKVLSPRKSHRTEGDWRTCPWSSFFTGKPHNDDLRNHKSSSWSLRKFPRHLSRDLYRSGQEINVRRSEGKMRAECNRLGPCKGTRLLTQNQDGPDWYRNSRARD